MRASSSCRRSNRAMRSACSACTCWKRTRSDCSRHVSLLLLYGVKAWLCGSIARVNHPSRPFKLFRAGFGTPTSCCFVSQGPLWFLLGPPPRPPAQIRRPPWIVQSGLCWCPVLSCRVMYWCVPLNCDRAGIIIVGLQVARKAIRDSAVVIVEGHCLRDEKVLKRRKRVPMNSTLGEICRTEVWSPLNVLARRVCMPRSKCALGRKLRKSLSIIPSR